MKFTAHATAEPFVAEPLGEEIQYLAGEVIADRYRLERVLGRGGMGVVWVAHSLALEVDVAVKLLHGAAVGSRVSTRMGREAHAAARLAHPALVRVFDFGWTQRQDPFLVMEFVRGETLNAVLRRQGSLGAIRAVQTLMPIADGLRVAHDRGIVHRDIKPDNILLATDGLSRVQPKLLDFGIAKVQCLDAGKLTQAGAAVGSPQYMSPEQAQGLETVDERTDVWSLCVTLYEMLTGTPPFAGANQNALMCSIIEDPVKAPPPATGDAGLWRIIHRGLAKMPEQRFATMSELGQALASWLYEHGVKEDVCGNSLRAVWLDSPTLPRCGVMASSIPVAGLRWSVSPSLFARRESPGWWAATGFVAAVAIVVFGIFEFTFAGVSESDAAAQPVVAADVLPTFADPPRQTSASSPLDPAVVQANPNLARLDSLRPQAPTKPTLSRKPASARKRAAPTAPDFGF